MTQNLGAIRRFILGGCAIFTLVSKISGDRKTFRVRKAEDVNGSGRPHGYYVDLLTGPDNASDYRYLLYMHLGWAPANPGGAEDHLYVKPNRQKWGADADRAFTWLVLWINRDTYGSESAQAHFERLAEFHHCGFCCRCGRLLTDPASIESGIGPKCAGRA